MRNGGTGLGTGNSALSQPEPIPEKYRLALEKYAALANDFERYRTKRRSENTRRAHAQDWADFTSFCEDIGASPLPAHPGVVVLYVLDCAQRYKLTTIRRRLATISVKHREAGYDGDANPARTSANTVLAEILDGMRRDKGVRTRQMLPLTIEDLRQMVTSLPRNGDLTLLDKRDRALLLFGFAGAFRRSELAGLKVEDLAFQEEGVVVTLHRSKTDQQGAGRKVGIPYGQHRVTCPVRAVRAWLRAARISTGVTIPV